MEKEIKIILTLENGEQVSSVLKVVNEDYEDILRTSEALKTNPVLKQFKNDLLEIGAVSSEASEGIAEFIKYNNVSEQQLNKVTAALKAEQASVGLLSSDYVKYENALVNINNAIAKTPPHVRQAGQSFTGMNQVIGQTGFLLSDMDMFFRSNDWVTNVRMGAMSVSNNFSMVGQTVANAMRNAEAQGMSWKDMLKSSLTGINAWTLGLNGGLLAVQFVTRFLSSNTEELKKNTEEIEKNKKSLAEKSRVALNTTITELKKEYDLLKKKRDIEKASFDARLEMSNKAKLARGEATSSPTFTFSQKDELEKAGQRLGEAQTALAVLGHEQNILNRINELEKERNSLQDNGASVRRTFLNEELEKLRDQLTIAQGKEKTEKTLAQQLKIRTTEEIDAELKKLNVLLSQTKVVADRLRILEQIKKLEAEKAEPLSIRSEDVLSKGASDKAPTDENKLREAIYGKLEPIKKEDMPDKPFVDTKDKVSSLKSAVQSLGSSMATVFANSITQVKNLKDVLNDVLSIILQIGLKLAIKSGLSLIPGLGPLVSELFSIRTSPVTPLSPTSEQGTTVQTLVVRVEGNSLTRGRDIYTAFNNEQKLRAAYG
ncbi:MAG: hypothetical protein A2440_09845 [Stygiobacter sp. RIFOXYC2_FULL_38_25]|nr:MAG: hypothetical protein A2299_16465 [Stygiobacter sp. RIFOXYB2_FULL_37_11]OGV13501.1 MAG: hypothetical protein A2237_17165 [Stygiobacter sp. RIFOXYA2_FULL_38_8]OGV14793.1 MAG: hypothetical protein A2440_09845 [Stygiobacter sp. RIFOXYC2_FULL_38_25]OGV79286.1 MAG: hypothetical protein A2X65_02215 [Stygiobacter sp. GWF2_38_21]